jgi:PIN domain nuclease of toxin-antitoxin system
MLLLDTHVLLWWASDDARLGPTARSAIQGAGRAVFVSAVTAWEIAIKQALGRLDAPDLAELLSSQGFRELALSVRHGLDAGALPPVHRDPFDRALIAQAAREGLTLVTADRLLERYDVALLDAAA